MTRGLILVFILVFLVSQAFAAGQGNPSEGKRLFRHYCAVCHGETGGGDGINAEHLDPRPADLSDPEYMATATKEDLFKVIEGGGKALEITPAMPPWGKTLSKDQIMKLVVYVQSLSRPPQEKARDIARSRIPERECRICHVKQERKPIAPDLAHVGSKLKRDWLYAFLKSPAKIRPVGFMPLTKSTMPNFQLTDEEALALADYLMTKMDERIPGERPRAMRMSEAEVRRGRDLYEEYACDACHRISEIGGIVGPDLARAGRRLQPDWMFRWLKNPQALRPDSPMPNLGLSDDQVLALVQYILSAGDETSFPAAPPPRSPSDLIKKGEVLFKDKNCLGCHRMGGPRGQEKRTADGS